MKDVRLTKYSHGAGCGCKISPQVLEKILQKEASSFHDPNLIIGNETKDDAAVYQLTDDIAIVSTTDFFMPIVDDPYDFGRIAATNAISDIYAMGGKPIMAIAILGWPTKLLPPEVAQQVIAGGRSVCHQAGISLAGGHSIDSPEPIFGLAVTGTVATTQVKQNNTAEAGCQLFLTKPLGIGVLTTAEKQGKLLDEHKGLACKYMCQLNDLGQSFATLPGVKAMTDVTGFGLLGHLTEICEGSQLKAEIKFKDIPYIPGVYDYIKQGCIPGGTERNYISYAEKIGPLTETQKSLLFDPQTSGGLLLAVMPNTIEQVKIIAKRHQIELNSIGKLQTQDSHKIIEVS